MENLIQDPDNASVQFARRVKSGLLEDVKITTTETIVSDTTSSANDGMLEIRTVTKTTITEIRVLTQNG